LRASGPAKREAIRRGRRSELAPRVAVVDSGPLYAVVDLDDQNHQRSITALQQPGLRLVIPALVIAEVAYLIGRRLGPSVEARFLATLPDYDVRSPEPEDWNRISTLVDRYKDFPLGAVDASVVVLADRLRTRLIATLDWRHFGVVQGAGGHSFELLPPPIHGR
jgi:uncharacterized protein